MSRPLTRTIEALVKIEAVRQDESSSSITVYHLSNSGQGPQVDIFFLPTSVVGFVQKAKAARYAATWNELVHQAWEIPPKPKKGQAETTPEPTALPKLPLRGPFLLAEPSRTIHSRIFAKKGDAIRTGAGRSAAVLPWVENEHKGNMGTYATLP